MEIELKRAVVFAILMQGGEGLMFKSPKYILEKWEVIKQHDEPEALLDPINRGKFLAWSMKWSQGISYAEY